MKIDAKGRMSIPAEFRRVLERSDPDWTDGLFPGLYLLYGPHLTDRLEVYSVESFDRIATKIDGMEEGSRRRRLATQSFLKTSRRLEVDKDGRIIVPQRQREERGLLGDVMLAGAGDHFEIWPAERYEAQFEGLKEWLSEQGEDFDPMSLLNEDT